MTHPSQHRAEPPRESLVRGISRALSASAASRRGTLRSGDHHCQLKSSRLFRGFLGVFGVFLLGIGTLAGTQTGYAGTLPLGASIAGESASGMSREDLENHLRQRANNVTVTITIDGSSVTVPLSQTGVSVDIPATAAAAEKEYSAVLPRATALLDQRDIPAVVTTSSKDASSFNTLIRDLIGQGPVDASVVLDKSGKTFVARPGRSGMGVDMQVVNDAVRTAATTLTSQNVTLTATEQQPTITDAQAQQAAERANALVKTDVALTFGQDRLVPSPEVKAQWITVPVIQGQLTPQVSRQAVGTWVKDFAAKHAAEPVPAVVNVDSSGAELEKARAGKDGVVLGNQDATVNAVITSMTSGVKGDTALAADTIPAPQETRVVSAGNDRFAYAARSDEKWVDVDLSDDSITAYIGTQQVHGPVHMNHGGNGYETKQGTFKVYHKMSTQDLGCSADYEWCVKDVPWITYYEGDFAIHGAPWAGEFGLGSDLTSHGCVNVPVAEAQWFYDWTEMGTTVVVHE
ncbi:MAG: L,D-transpeptidase [Actinomycetaceae bacterium]|nr:L,D-transpeptidase [Actinomycetaceae bacterium]